MGCISVAIPGHEHDVHIEPGILARIDEVALRTGKYRGACVLADEAVYKLHGSKVENALRKTFSQVVVGLQPQGEANKTLDTVRNCYDVLLNARLDRDAVVFSFGGGVNGDTAGFVAATYLRGVAFIQCPTTLLAMVDSSVGGKTGVNVPQGKNLIGSFYQPKAVVIDPEVLRTLPRRELCCGLAECVKHAVIADDSLFSWIEAKLPQILALEMPVLVELLERNIAIKARIVEQDEKEQGIRAYLNLGHTFGHAIEATAGYGVIEHGEAVALGMIAAFELAVSLGICGCEAAERVRRLIERIGLPVKADLAANEALIAAMASDKKRKDSAVRFVLPERIGAVRIISGAERGSLNAAWDSLR